MRRFHAIRKEKEATFKLLKGIDERLLDLA